MEEAQPGEVATAWLAAMRRGDWEAAWQQTDRIELARRRAQRSGSFVRQPHHLLWNGGDFAGRTVLVRCEHGLGDTLQFIRFVPHISRVAREVHLLVQPHLLGLLAGAPGLGAVHDAWTDQPAPPHDVEIEVMELAYALRARADRVAPPYPFLADQVRGRFAPIVPPGPHLRVGLVWAASDWDTSRSIPLTGLEPLLRTQRVRFFSLQQGTPANDLRCQPLDMVALSHLTGEIGAAAAAMLELDLVISVDGMPAHLAATLGRPTWLLLKHDADWRWMEGRSDTPWYPTMRLFRQPRVGDWEAVITAAAKALSAFG